MYGSMADIQSATTEIIGEEKKERKKKVEEKPQGKIYGLPYSIVQP